MYYLINANGQFVSSIDGTPAEVISQTPPNHTTTILAPPRSTDYWNGSNWVPIGSPPAYYFKFNYATKQWVDSRDINVVRTEKWNKIKLERNLEEFGGFTYKDMRFDSDQISQGRILAAYIFNQPVAWTLANDDVVSLSVEELQEVAATMAMHVNSTHEKARIARIAINTAKTISEVESVLFDGKP